MSADEYPADPVEVLAQWLPSNDDPARPAMTLATATHSGPDARTLLLSEWDENGFYFHTDSRSRKVAQLAAHPQVALVLHFPDRLRQLTVQGTAEPAADAELAWAFAHRSDYLKQLAWQNTREFAGLPYPDRVTAWAQFRTAHADGFGQPPTWTGFLVRPTRLTFWVGDPETASRRTEYARTGVADGWAVSVHAG